MEINTFDIVKVDFGEANFSGEQRMFDKRIDMNICSEYNIKTTE